MALRGSNVTLLCSAASASALPLAFQWKRNNVELGEGFRRHEERHNATVATSVLFLDNVATEHVGNYQCVVSNSFGVVYSARSRIAVGTLPVFRATPANVTVKAGDTARLDCAALGDPRPQMAWQKDGGNDFPAARERRMHVMPADDAFFIINAKTTDQALLEYFSLPCWEWHWLVTLRRFCDRAKR
uniref:Putative membrane glycoprotein lig-1 n=1 Tax=Phlebotomus kandelakii TaxID=1109342 RepID=A0A6B2EFF4_9DIPT